MTAFDSWRQKALERAQTTQVAGVERWPQGAPLYWWFGKYVPDYADFGESVDHLFWELHYEHSTGAWIVCGAVVSVDAHAFSVIESFLVEQQRDETQALQRIAFDFAKIFPLIAYDFVLEFAAAPATARYEMHAIRIGVTLQAEEPRPGTPDARIDERLDCATADALAGKLVDIPCPDCAGSGATKTFAIPQADRESGATGYALYSANTVNATVACTACGGSGAAYEAWYLAEQPALRGASALIKGRGLVQARRLPCHGSLTPC